MTSVRTEKWYARQNQKMPYSDDMLDAVNLVCVHLHNHNLNDRTICDILRAVYCGYENDENYQSLLWFIWGIIEDLERRIEEQWLA